MKLSVACLLLASALYVSPLLGTKERAFYVIAVALFGAVAAVLESHVPRHPRERNRGRR